MSDERAWLERIAADDTERLVYADWLDEQGQGDKATFVRAEHQTHAARQSLVALESRLDADWRRAVSRPETESWTVIHVRLRNIEDYSYTGYALVPDADIWPALREALEGSEWAHRLLVQRALGIVPEPEWDGWEWWSDEDEQALRENFAQDDIERADRLLQQRTWAEGYSQEDLISGQIPTLTLAYAPERAGPPALPEGLLQSAECLRLGGGLHISSVYELHLEPA